MITLDASATVDWLLQTSTGQRIANRIYLRNEFMHAPHLLDVEVTQVLRRLLRDKTVPAYRADEAIADLLHLRLTRYPHLLLHPRIWLLRHTLSAYDAAYIALAELRRASLVTCDRKLGSASRHHATVEVL